MIRYLYAQIRTCFNICFTMWASLFMLEIFSRIMLLYSDTMIHSWYVELINLVLVITLLSWAYIRIFTPYDLVRPSYIISYAHAYMYMYIVLLAECGHDGTYHESYYYLILWDTWVHWDLWVDWVVMARELFVQIIMIESGCTMQ